MLLCASHQHIHKSGIQKGLSSKQCSLTHQMENKTFEESKRSYLQEITLDAPQLTAAFHAPGASLGAAVLGPALGRHPAPSDTGDPVTTACHPQNTSLLGARQIRQPSPPGVRGKGRESLFLLSRKVAVHPSDQTHVRGGGTRRGEGTRSSLAPQHSSTATPHPASRKAELKNKPGQPGSSGPTASPAHQTQALKTHSGCVQRSPCPRAHGCLPPQGHRPGRDVRFLVPVLDKKPKPNANQNQRPENCTAAPEAHFTPTGGTGRAAAPARQPHCVLCRCYTCEHLSNPGHIKRLNSHPKQRAGDVP